MDGGSLCDTAVVVMCGLIIMIKTTVNRLNLKKQNKRKTAIFKNNKYTSK